MPSRLIALVCLMTVAASAALADAKEDANKQTVLAFYEVALNKKDADAAVRYLGAKYVQHNPSAADGAEGLKGFIQFLRDKFPQSRNEVKRALADGDFVVLHVHSVREPNTRGRAIIDIFRLENGKIVEHWDAIQDIPEKAANSNGMF